jgi:hypothetical protein
MKTGTLNEIDWYLAAHAPLFTIESGPLKGNVSGTIDVADWNYTSKIESPHGDDQGADLVLKYRDGFVDVDLDLSHVLSKGLTLNRNSVQLNISKQLEIIRAGDKRVALSFGARTAYNNDYSGNFCQVYQR